MAETEKRRIGESDKQRQTSGVRFRFSDSPFLRFFKIYTDGATSGNPGPSGWGAVILGAGRREEIGGFVGHSTNNRMELTAVIEALRNIGPDAEAEVYSDSAYVIEGITRHINKWRQNGFLTAAKRPVENRDLWEDLDALDAGRARYVKVPAHAGNRENERANEIAQAYARKKKMKLKDGPHVDRPEPRPRIPAGVKFPAYVVLENGGMSFYRTWEECRNAVEGRACRYKKCKSEEDLAYFLSRHGR